VAASDSSHPVDFVALIPARLASTRLPDKPLADIAGQPMIVHVAQRAAAAGARRVAVATDSQAVAQAVRAAGFEAVLTRADHASGTDRLAEAAAAMGLADDDLIVNGQGGEPLIAPALLRDVAQLLAQAPDCAMATAAHPIDTLVDFLNPSVVKVVCDAHWRALYFSRAPLPFERDALPGFPAQLPNALPPGLAAAGLPLRHIGLYAYRMPFLQVYPTLPRAPLETLESLEQLRALWHGHRIAVLRTEHAPAPGVDTPEALRRVREWFAAQAAAAPAATGSPPQAN